jgi:hypothetical protein
MVSGWSTHEKLACSCYMKNNKTFTLTNNSKMFFFLLPLMVVVIGSQVKKEQNNFFISRVEENVPLLVPSGEELYDVIS